MYSGTLGEALRIMNDAQDFTEKGKCSNCGACCSDWLPMTKKDIARIQKYIVRHGVREVKTIIPSIEPTINLICPFRNQKERKCNIYEVRPEICRIYDCRRMKDNTLPTVKKHKDFKLVSVREVFFGNKASTFETVFKKIQEKEMRSSGADNRH